MKGDFYNTIAEKGQELEISREKVDRQEDVILAVFQKYHAEWGRGVLA